MNKKYGIWRAFWGLFFLAAAAAVALSAAGIFTFGINIGWLLLIIFLSAIGIGSLVKLQWFGFFMPAAGIITILATQTDLVNLSGRGIGTLWATAALVAIGFSILFHRRWGSHNSHKYRGDYDKVIDEADGEETTVHVSFGSTIKYINSEDFRRAVLECQFGAIKAYFDNAKIKGDSAVIEINGSFSGVELFIPRNWRVVNDLHANLAGVEEKNGHGSRSSDSEKGGKTVTLVGNINLAGVEITYV